MFNAKIQREHCNFLGVQMNTKGEIPQSELTKIISNAKKQIALWTSIKLSLSERATILKCFQTSRLVYCCPIIQIEPIKHFKKYSIIIF
jgi:ABC-type phosphate transport system ATPase subunit